MRKSRLSRVKQNWLIELLVEAPTERTAVSLVGVNKNTESCYFLRLCQLIYDHSEEVGFLENEVEIDESYFGGRYKSIRGRGAAGQALGFGLLKRNGRI